MADWADPKAIIDYISDEMEALDEDEDEPSTLRDMSEDESDEGSLKEFIADSQDDSLHDSEADSSSLDEDELEMYDNPRKRRRLTGSQIERIRRKKKKMKERMERDEQEAIDASHIIQGRRRTRRPVAEIYKPDDNFVRNMMMVGVDEEYLEETEQRDMERAKTDDEDDEEFVPESDDSDDDFVEDSDDTTDSVLSPVKRAPSVRITRRSSRR